MKDDKITSSDEKDNRFLSFIRKNNKIKKICFTSVVLFFTGHMFIYLGLAKGNDIATSLSRPYGTSFWTTSQEFIEACTYSPILLGGSLILLSIIFITVVLIEWLKEK